MTGGMIAACDLSAMARRLGVNVPDGITCPELLDEIRDLLARIDDDVADGFVSSTPAERIAGLALLFAARVQS